MAHTRAPSSRYQVSVEYGLLLREDVIRRLSHAVLLHHLERSWACAMDVTQFWPVDVPLPRRYAVAREPIWTKSSDIRHSRTGNFTDDGSGMEVVLHLRDVRFSKELLAMKYMLRGERGYTVSGFEHWQRGRI